MRAVRRFYFYLVAFISLELILWGIYDLISSLWNAPTSVSLEDLLARGLSQILIGLPIFVLHWRTIQRDALQDPEERQSIVRAAFLYTLRLVTLVPVLTSMISLLRILGMSILAAENAYLSFLAIHNPFDNLTSLVLNLMVWFGTELILRKEWALKTQKDALALLRRIYRYLWMLLGIGTLTSGIQLLLGALFSAVPQWESINLTLLINGISLCLVATPVWMQTWHILCASYKQSIEKDSILRLIVIFAISLISLAVTLSLSGILLNHLMQALLDHAFNLQKWINQDATLFSTLIPFAVLYFYYNPRLAEVIKHEIDLVRQNSIQRLYATVLSFAGTILSFIGVWTLLILLADFALGKVIVGSGWQVQLSHGIAELAIGLPLWLRSWIRIQGEATNEHEFGLHTRRSVIRKTYLYLIIFAAVIGLMAAGGLLFYRLINAALGEHFDDLILFSIKQVLLLSLIAIWLIYHRKILKRDAAGTQANMDMRIAAYPVLIIEHEDDFDFYNQVVQKLIHYLPDLRVTRCASKAWQGLTSPDYPAAIIMTGQVFFSLPHEIQNMLNDFSGQFVIIPTQSEKMTFVGVTRQKTDEVIKDLIQTTQFLAEGRKAKPAPAINAWVIVGYVFGSIFVLYFLLMLFFGVIMR
jgi:hypothetical protein